MDQEHIRNELQLCYNPKYTRWWEYVTDEILSMYMAGMLPLEEWYKVTEMDSFYVYMTCINGSPVGQVQVTMYEGDAHISVLVNPMLKGRGYGKASVMSILELPELSDIFKKVDKVKAGISPGNIASIKCFEACGFIHEGCDNDGFLIYSKTV